MAQWNGGKKCALQSPAAEQHQREVSIRACTVRSKNHRWGRYHHPGSSWLALSPHCPWLSMLQCRSHHKKLPIVQTWLSRSPHLRTRLTHRGDVRWTQHGQDRAPSSAPSGCNTHPPPSPTTGARGHVFFGDFFLGHSDQ